MSGRQAWINPVLGKEFRLRMRSVRSALAIFAYLSVIGLLALGYVYVTTNQGASDMNAEVSRAMFYFLSGAQLVLIAFVTPGLTGGVISGEREKQTLNMLLTTQQSSTAIILSKLLSSLSFMFLIVFATLPVYGIVFLYGGVSPGQLIGVFAFYVLVMIAIGSVGVFCSTMFRKTVAAVVATYGFTLLIFALTGLLLLFLMVVAPNWRYLGQVVIGLNPMAAMMSILMPEISRSVAGTRTALELWQVFVPAYTALSALMIGLSIRYLRPVMKRGRGG